MKLILSAFYLTTSCAIVNYTADSHAYTNARGLNTLVLEGVDNHSYDVTAESDTVNVVFFSTTWCCHCPYVCGTLSSLAKDNTVKNRKIRFFFVLIGNESDAQVKSHFSNTNSNVVVCRSISSARLNNQISSVPCCIVFDKHGKAVFRHEGKKNYDSKDFQRFLIGLAQANPLCTTACNIGTTCYKMSAKVGSKVSKRDKIRKHTAKRRGSSISKKGKANHRKNITQKRS